MKNEEAILSLSITLEERTVVTERGGYHDATDEGENC
jgi:hypothetical protein